MILIWGWKVICKTLGMGVFRCPTEGADRQYSHRSARRFFTVRRYANHEYGDALGA